LLVISHWLNTVAFDNKQKETSSQQSETSTKKCRPLHTY